MRPHLRLLALGLPLSFLAACGSTTPTETTTVTVTATSASTTSSASPPATSSSTSSSGAADPYAGWATYSSPCTGLTFRYPATWRSVVGTGSPFKPACRQVTFTTPAGSQMTWAPFGWVPGSDGPPCTPYPSCMTVTTTAIQPLSAPGVFAHSSAVSEVVCVADSGCTADVTAVTSGVTPRRIGTATGAQDGGEVFGTAPSKYATWSMSDAGPGNSENTALTEAQARAWLSSADGRDAVLVMESTTG